MAEDAILGHGAAAVQHRLERSGRALRKPRLRRRARRRRRGILRLKPAPHPALDLVQELRRRSLCASFHPMALSSASIAEYAAHERGRGD